LYYLLIQCYLKREMRMPVCKMTFSQGFVMSRGHGATKRVGMVPMDQLPDLDGWWLWPERIPMGNLTLVVGDQDAGKSRVAWDLAARVSRGDRWPDGEANPMGPGSILLVSSENHLQIAVRPALKAAGAEMSKIVCVGAVHEENQDSEKRERPFDLRLDLDALGKIILEMRDCRMVIIDSISAYLGSGGGAKTAELLRGLMVLAIRYRLAVVGLTHLRKGNGEAIRRVVGGLTLTSAARCIWSVLRGPNPSDGRLMLPLKNNLSAEQTGLAFDLVVDPEKNAPRVEWSSDAIEATSDEAMGTVRSTLKEQPKAVQEAMKYLEEALSDGPRWVKELEAAGKEQRGISQITMRRARVALGVQTYREVIPGPWRCRLSEASCQLPVVGCQPSTNSCQEDQRPEIGEDRRALDTRCESADHVDHLAETGRNFEDMTVRSEDHVEHLAARRDDLAMSEHVEAPDDPVLCGACRGDSHEAARMLRRGTEQGRRKKQKPVDIAHAVDTSHSRYTRGSPSGGSAPSSPALLPPSTGGEGG
jgi:putative DNA primase/helicase